MRRLIESGVRGELKSLPIRHSNSAVIWTSIATGKTADKHGIEGFVVPGSTTTLRLYTSGLRRQEAFWNILSDAGKRVGVVGWWVTWPVERVNGAMISYDFYPARPSRGPCEGCPGGAGDVRESLPRPATVYPPELRPETSSFIVLERDLVDRQAALVHDGPTYHNGELWPYARDTTMFRAARWLLQRQRFDVFAVYFESLDAIQHVWWRDLPGEGIWQPSAYAATSDRVAGRVLRYYEYVDSLIGALSQAAGSPCLTIVVSDHGFQTYPDRREEEYAQVRAGMVPGKSPPPWGHSDTGVFIASGPGIAAGRRLDGATIYDVLPTLLYAEGLPYGADMDGKPLLEAFDASFRASRPARTVATYERGEPSRPIAVGDSRGGEQGVIDALKSLGYLK